MKSNPTNLSARSRRSLGHLLTLHTQKHPLSMSKKKKEQLEASSRLKYTRTNMKISSKPTPQAKTLKQTNLLKQTGSLYRKYRREST